MKMFLIQPATVPRRTSWQSGGQVKSLLKALDIKLTGHPGLSNGAIPDALLRFINCRRKKVFGQIKLRVGELGSPDSCDLYRTFYYLVREHQELELRSELENWSIKAPKTAVPVRPAKLHSFQFHIEEGEECFFWASAHGRALIEWTLPESVRVFKSAMKPVRPTVLTIENILNQEQPVVEDRFNRMERHDD